MDTNPLVNRNEFRFAIFDFFSKLRGGHLDKYAYLTPINWEKLVDAVKTGESSYYLAHPDIEVPVLERIAEKEALIKENGSEITQIFEVGPGTGQKIIPFIEKIKTLKGAVLIDYEMEFNESAHNAIRTVRTDIPVTLIQQDFESLKFRTKISGNPLGLILGGTICNMDGRPEDCTEFPTQKLTDKFNSISNLYHDDGFLITTIDSGTESEILKAYSGEFNRNFVLGALDLIPQTLDTDLTTEKIEEYFQHQPQYHKQCAMIAHSALCPKGASFMIEGYQFNLPAGWSNSIINSFKPSEDQVIEAADKAGFIHSETLSNDKGLIKVLKFRFSKKHHLDMSHL